MDFGEVCVGAVLLLYKGNIFLLNFRKFLVKKGF